MRKLLGGLVLVAGVGGLGWYASQGPAVTMQDEITAAAAAVAGAAVHGVDAVVSGRDITVTGTVADAAEQDSLQAAFDAIPGRRVLNMTGLEPLPVASPFFFSIAKTDAGVNALGNAPSAAAATDLGFEGLDIAAGAPEGWSDAVTTALGAIEGLETANVVVADSNIAVTGVAASPAELAAYNAAMADLPEGFQSTSEIELLDDGTPLRMTLNYDGAILSGSGKIPADFDRDAVAVDGAQTQLDLQDARDASEDGQWPAFAQAAVTALGAMESGDLTLEGQSATLTGITTPDGVAAAEGALADLPDGYVVETKLTLFDDGAPFALDVQKTADGLTGAGKVPADFEAPAGLDTLTTAFITDETGVWPGIATAGLSALDALEVGTLEITDGAIALTGDAFSPTERDAALAAIAGYDATTDIALRDDGAPLSLTLTYSADAGASASGKVPADLEVADIAAALDLEVTDAGLSPSVLDTDTDFLAPLADLRGFLPELSGLTYVASDADASIDATAAPGVDAGQIADAMQAALGDGVAVDLQERTDLPAAGATRVNRFSGLEETFTAGYWLPTYDFFPTPEACAEQSDAILAANKVEFLTGSAELDVQSIRAINALSALARKCALEGGVFLQVAGHTDNTGDADANLALSEARANAVRDEILARGLARAVVSAQGFGDADPIASNDTEEGRAANRRTAFNWNFE